MIQNKCYYFFSLVLGGSLVNWASSLPLPSLPFTFTPTLLPLGNSVSSAEGSFPSLMAPPIHSGVSHSFAGVPSVPAQRQVALSSPSVLVQRQVQHYSRHAHGLFSPRAALGWGRNVLFLTQHKSRCQELSEPQPVKNKEI